jgi:hypothetical protein
MFFANQQPNGVLAKNVTKSNEHNSTSNHSASYNQQNITTIKKIQAKSKTISSSKSKSPLNKAKTANSSHTLNRKERRIMRFSFKIFFLISYFLLFLNNCLLAANAEISINLNRFQKLDQSSNVSNHNSQQYAIKIDKHEDEQLKMLKRREEIERIKSETLMDVFKTKILKLLNVEQVPSPTEINIAHNSIPEPILKEYHRLIRVSRMERSKRYNLKNKFPIETRGSRDLESDENELEHEEFIDEAVRFNGSVVQKIMLLPNKSKHLFN